MRRSTLFVCSTLALSLACSDDGNDGIVTTLLPTTVGETDTDASSSESTDTDSGDGDGDPTDSGDGDGDPTTGNSGDGDGDPATDTDEPPPECGNGIVEDGEACDDGNDIDDDECSNDCQFPNCGDGIVQDGEECDVGEETMFCDGDCTYSVCGDGYHNMLSEECDDGNDSNEDGCVGPCLLNVCGDGYLNMGVEDCDDQNMIDTDECTNACLAPVCGDGIIWEDNETCDDQNDIDTDACTNACQLAICGDGILWEGEETCDDGNFDDSDACPGSCEPAFCGDGFVQAGLEDCDDGNNQDDDGCDAQCVWEDGGLFELTFEDNSNADDIGDTAMLDLFNSIGNPQPTDFVFFSVIGSVSNDGAWCATRGDWYRDQYISNYGQSTSIVSGNWDKWSSPDGVNWSATVNQGYTNYYGATCDSTPGSWCSEWGVGPDSMNLVITPQQTDTETFGDGWNNGITTFTFRYGANRMLVCGF